MRAYHDRKRHRIRLTARALVVDVADGEPGDGCQRGFCRSTSDLVKPMSWSMWSSSSASARRAERARQEVIMRFSISFHMSGVIGLNVARLPDQNLLDC